MSKQKQTCYSLLKIVLNQIKIRTIMTAVIILEGTKVYGA
jgi:hypothetical protein